MESHIHSLVLISHDKSKDWFYHLPLKQVDLECATCDCNY